jgi:RHS repeat-associated protein
LVNADKSSVARVENRTIGSEGTLPRRLIRYQLSDLLSSCSLEIDPHGDLISYEEYTAFGSTAYQAVRNTSEAVKYIRFMGKERDEESGFYYCNDRYFAPWLGRWTACDPSGLVDGPNLYVYAQNRPTTLIDPTGRKANEPAETATSEASKGRRSSKPAKPPTPEYIEFEKRVGTPEDPGGTKILTAEEKGSHLADVRTTEHFEAVKKVVNEAIIIATEHFRDKTTGELTAVHDEILAYALMELIKPMREKDLKNSQNLILRDADHYFAGRIQEWQILFPNSFVALTLQSSATVTYDMGKMISWKVSSWFEDDDDAAAKKSSGQTPSIFDTSEQPASPGGGWEFADLGMRHFVRDSAKSDEKVAPALLTETFEGEQKHFERELQRQIDAARFRGMMGYP